MNIIKLSKNNYTVKLTKAEQKAADEECKKILIEWEHRHQQEIDAMILWRLHHTFGWGLERLWRFYKGFHDDTDELIERYEMDASDDLWLATQALKEYGIDLNDWEKEIEKTRSEKK